MSPFGSIELFLDGLATFLLGQAIDACWLVILVLVISRFVRHDAIVHTLWLAVFLKLLTPPLFELPVPVPALAIPAQATPTSTTLLSSTTETPSSAPPSSWQANPAPVPRDSSVVDDPLTWIGLLFLMSTLGLGVLALVRAVRFRQQLEAATEPSATLLTRMRTLARRLELDPVPTVRMVEARLSPMLWARWRRAELLLPSMLVERLDSAELDAVLVHELAHLKRRDHWVRCLEMVTTGFFWWYPPLRLMRRRLHRAEERACDAWVQQLLPGSGRAYARALVKTLDFLNPKARSVPALACAMQPQQDWKERLTMIVTQRTAKPLSTWQRGFVAVCALLLLSIVPTLAKAGSDEPMAGQIEQARQGLEQQREELERQHQTLQRQQLAIEEQMMALRNQQIDLEAKRHEAESRFQTASLEAEAVRLEAQGHHQEAERVRRELEHMREEVALAERHLRLEREHHTRRDAAELALRQAHLELEEVQMQGDRELARQLEREIEERHDELERQVEAAATEQIALERARIETARERAHELQARGDEEQAAAAAQGLAELERVEAEIEAREAELESRNLDRDERRAVKVAHLEEQLEALRDLRDAAPASERGEVEGEIDQLEEELQRLRQ